MKKEKPLTEGWTLSIGTTPGYELSDQQAMTEDSFTDLYMKEAEEIWKETGIYISAVVREVRMLYHSDWGCPKGGELGFELHGVRNPAFSEKEGYRAALEKLVDQLRKKLNQTAVYLEIYTTELLYMVEEGI